MKITWVNHASFILTSGNIRLISDPWLEGSAFDNGWSLLSKSALSYDDFGDITHIWFSHEHPDHFSVPNLRSIPPHIRKNITVLFQTRRDKRIVDFCKKLEFGHVVELPSGKWHSLNSGFRVMCQCDNYASIDSWLAMELEEKLLLNLNDCILDKHGLRRLKRLLPDRRPDILFTQFSYANWAGNKNDLETRRRSAQNKLQQILSQARTFRPTIIVPFASFVWFSHEENYYMNDLVNKIDDVRDFITNNTAAKPVVLYPGDTWTPGTSHDSDRAIARYLEDFGAVQNRPTLTRVHTASLDTLTTAAQKLLHTIKSTNPTWLTALFYSAGMLRPAHIYLADHGSTHVFDFRNGLAPSSRPASRCDVEMSSDSLLYCFENAWGCESLEVNGRHQIPPDGRYANFHNHFRIYRMNSNGYSTLQALPIWIANKIAAQLKL